MQHRARACACLRSMRGNWRAKRALAVGLCAWKG